MKRILSSVLCLAMAAVLGATVFMTPTYAATKYEVKENSPLKGINVGFYGDSICAASVDKNNTTTAAVRGWAGRVGVTNQMVWQNHGVGGASVSNVRGTNTIMAQLKNVHKTQHEMIILHGGTNDAWDGARVGEMTEGFEPSTSDVYDVTTFAGGLEQIFAYLREKKPDATLGYIINFKFVNANKGVQKQIPNPNGGKPFTVYILNNMEEYVEMTKQICDKWGVEYLDLYSDDELTNKLHPKNDKGQYDTTYVYDFIHPSSAGYDILYPYVEEFLIDLITPDPVVTEPITDPVVTDPVTEPVTEPADTKKDGGCKSTAVSTVAVIAVISLAGATLFAKKKD